MTKMNPEVKGPWLEALRSGEYEQAQKVLTNVDLQTNTKSYCCLGVLCDVATKMGLPITIAQGPRAYKESDVIEYDGWDATLPPSVQEWAGIKDDIGFLPTEFHEVLDDGTILSTLTEYNDNGYSFEQIADIIEKAF